MTKNEKDIALLESVMAYGATKEEAANAALRIAFDETATRAAFGENAK